MQQSARWSGRERKHPRRFWLWAAVAAVSIGAYQCAYDRTGSAPPTVKDPAFVAVHREAVCALDAEW